MTAPHVETLEAEKSRLIRKANPTPKDMRLIFAYDAAIALMRGQSWQPIETAPKDGISIIGYSDGAMATVRWCALGNYWELVVVGGWAEDDEWEPTHWQPLPAQPKDTADEQ